MVMYDFCVKHSTVQWEYFGKFELNKSDFVFERWLLFFNV